MIREWMMRGVSKPSTSWTNRQEVVPDRVADLVIRSAVFRAIRGNHFMTKAASQPCQQIVTTGRLFGNAARDARATWSAVCMGRRLEGRKPAES